MNRFYLFILLLFIQYFGFSQCDISIDYSSSSTFECYIEGQNASALVIANVGGLAVSGIEFNVIEGGLSEVVTTSEANEALAKFYDPGNYVIQLTHINDDECIDTVHFFVNDPVDSLEFTIPEEEYYLCDNVVSINLNLANSSSYDEVTIFVSSEITYNDFHQGSNLELIFNQEELINLIKVDVETDANCEGSQSFTNINILDGPSSDDVTLNFLEDNLCFDVGSDNSISLSVESILEYDNYFPTEINISPEIINPILLNDTFEDTIEIYYPSFDECTIQKPASLDYSILYTTNFEVIKINSAGNEEVYLGVLCNDEKIRLTNTSVHYSSCPECFDWDLGPLAINVVEQGETVTFSYNSDPAEDVTWSLNYMDSTGECIDSHNETWSINVDYIEASFTANPTVICEDSGDVEMISTSTVGNNPPYTYSWSLNNDNGDIVSQTGATATLTLPSPGEYDVTLVIESDVGCSVELDSSSVVKVIGNTIFELEYDGALCNDERIKLINTSSDYSFCPECFDWDLDPLAVNIVEQGDTVSFSYDSDPAGDVTWTLNYTDSTGECTDSHDETRSVNTDYIYPVLTEGLNQSSCSFDTIIELSHQTILGNDPLDEYMFTWIVIPNDTTYGFAIEDTIYGTQTPTFNIESSYNQSYSIQLVIENQGGTGCSGSLLSQDFFTISAVDNSIESNSTSTCLPNLVEIYTQDIDIIETYSWMVISVDTLINISSNQDSLSLDLIPGLYDVYLTTETFDGCIHNSHPSLTAAYIIVNDYEVSINEVSSDTICLNGSNTVNKNFSSLITPEIDVFSYTVIDYNWEIISSNSGSATKTDLDSLNVSYTFSNPGIYNIQYSATIQGSNNNCEYISAVETFFVGIDVGIVSSPIICVGGDTFTASMDSADNWSTGLAYEWSSNSFIDITSANDSTTSISTDSLIDPDVTKSYDLTLRVNNDRDCWEEETVNIDAYQVYADIDVFDGLLHCLPQEITLSSAHNEYIEQYNWNLYLNDSCNYDVNGYSNDFNSYSIGDTVGGGILFSIDNQSLTGLVVAYNDLPGNYEWGCLFNGINDANNPSGYVNTQDIINTPCSTLNGGITAAQAATNANINGYNDWFLPSIIELQTIYESLPLGSSAFISDSSYWSSTQLNFLNSFNFTLTFQGGTLHSGTSSPASKSELFKVRPIRSVFLSESCLEPTLYSSDDQLFDVYIDSLGYFDIYFHIESQHGCRDSIWQDSSLVVNKLDPVIETIDTLLCFDGDSVLYKQFVINFNSELDVDFSSKIVEFEWNVSPIDSSYFGEAPSVSIIESSVDSLSVFFDESAVYKISYSMAFENSFGNPCDTIIDTLIEIGVNTNLILPSIVCVGESFEVNANVFVGIGDSSVFSWETNSDMIFTSSDSLISNIDIQGELQANEISKYGLEFTVLNDNGCLIKTIDSITVYEVVADFSVSDQGAVCFSELISFESLNNDYISTYEWSYSGIKYDGDSLNYIFPSNNDELTHFFTEMGNYDFTLSTISFHGCVDTLTKDSIFDIKRPYPSWSIDQNIGCDELNVSILDLSEQVNNIYYYSEFYAPVIEDSSIMTLQTEPLQSYVFNEVNNFDFLFPYNDLDFEEVEYVYPIMLETRLNECINYLYDTITVYANPIIDVSFSADSGCNPDLTVDFFDHSTYVDSDSAEYLWNFGTEICCSSVQNPSWDFPGTLGDTMVYDVYLTITSNRGCSTTEFITTVRVYDNPQANFDYSSGPFCYGLADVYFSDSTSLLTTEDPLDSVIWTYNGVDSLEETNQDYMIHFDVTGTYEVSLEIVDVHGCRDTVTDSEVYVEELDTIVALPILNYVTWSDSGVILNYPVNQDEIFSNLFVNFVPGYGDISDANRVAMIDSLTGDYLHENGSDGLSGLYANDYYLTELDSCGYQSDSSIIHSSILLEASSDEYQEIDISWTRYRGWEYNIIGQSIVPDTVEVTYTVYRSENNIDFESIITIADSIYPSLPYIDSKFSYTDVDLCNLNYTYYVIASHPDIEDFVSKSNNVNKEPKFVDFTKPLNLSYTTVNIYGTLTVDGESVENYTLTEWEELDQSDMNYYKVDRFDNYYGWQEEVNKVTDSIFLDFNADVNNDEYLYRVSYWDDCGNEGPESNIGSNILLIGVQNSTHYDLSWNPYKDWSLGVQNYIIEYYQSQNNIWVELDIVSGTTLDYIDSDLQKNDLSDSYDLLHGIDTSYCYRVRAIGYSESESQSNEYCFIAEPTNYFPNAFSPNNDGINDYLEYRFSSYQSDNDPNIQTSSFVKSINLQIFNKWGNLVFETNDLDFKWDGTIQNNGEVCPQGAYVLRYELIGYNGSVISDKGLIYLLR